MTWASWPLSVCVLRGVFPCRQFSQSQKCESWWVASLPSLLSMPSAQPSSAPHALLRFPPFIIMCRIWVNFFLTPTSLPALPRRESWAHSVTPSYPAVTQTLTICAHTSFGEETTVLYLILHYRIDNKRTYWQILSKSIWSMKESAPLYLLSAHLPKPPLSCCSPLEWKAFCLEHTIN